MNPHVLDEALWLRVLTSKQTQGLAWKIERAMQADAESRELVKMLAEKWAELQNVRSYFPDLTDVFNPEAVFQIEYVQRFHLYRNDPRPRSLRYAASRVYDVLAYISNLVARHEVAPAQLKRMYNSQVLRWPESRATLPLFDVGEIEDGRISANKPLYIPKALQGLVEAKPKKRTRAKKAKSIEKQIDELDLRISIGPGATLIIHGEQ